MSSFYYIAIPKMKKLLLMFASVWFVILWCNYSYAANGITYNNNLTTRTDLNWNSFSYWTITIEHNWDSITMMDRNLWATTNNINSSRSYGYHYQWWNNYWFDLFDESVKDDAIFRRTVDASRYWPWNYYFDDAFRAIRERPFDWSNPSNNNLRWWSWDSRNNNRWFDLTNSIADRQWPCPDWYHVPSIWEFDKVLEYRSEENWLNLEDGGNEWLEHSYYWREYQTDFKIPFAGFRDGDEVLVYATGYDADLWSSSPDMNSDYGFAYSLWITEFYTVGVSSTSRANAHSVRCFKNPNNENTSSSQWNNNNNNFEYDTLRFNPYYSDEMNMAYQYSRYYDITTANNIKEADMNGWLNRIAMAKMLSYFAENVLWIDDFDTRRTCNFIDVPTYLDRQYNYWVTKACQLGIMWVNMPNNRFYPNWWVTRAEFATALSRLLYWTKDWTDVYYSTHISKLYKKWIISNTNPNLREKRWYVMLMLMRADKNYVPVEINYPNTHSPNKIDTNNIYTKWCNYTTSTLNQYNTYHDMPNKNWTDDAKFVNKALQDVRDNGQYLVKNYIDEANRVLDSAWLTKRDQCRYSLLIDELENQKWFIKSYRKENWKMVIWIDFISYKENITWDDFRAEGAGYFDVIKNTSTKVRYYTLNDNVELQILNIDDSWYAHKDNQWNYCTYISNWDIRLNSFCNWEPIYNWFKYPSEWELYYSLWPDRAGQDYNWNEWWEYCMKDRILGSLDFWFDDKWNISKINGSCGWFPENPLEKYFAS